MISAFGDSSFGRNAFGIALSLGMTPEGDEFIA